MYLSSPPQISLRGPSVLLVILGVLALSLAASAWVYLSAYHSAAGNAPDDRISPEATGSPGPTTAAGTPSPTAPPSYAAKGPNTYVYATGESPVFGSSGTLRKYRVAIETGTPVPVQDFAALVDKTLGDPRSWIGGNNVRLQRVAGDAAGVNFTVLLVTPGTAQDLCLAGNLDIYWHGEPYSSCQVGSRAIINISRYVKGIPNYGAPLEAYDQYAVNHEVGHVLGHGHELCPAKGQPAPVMQQQTFDLQGCTANSWPYLDGKRYAGPPGRIIPSD